MAEIRSYSFSSPATEPASLPPANTGADLSRLNFLVVDSIPDMRAATCSLLTGFGAGRVDYTGRASDAIGMMRRGEYDVILSEFDLGTGFDGLYLFEEARRHGILKASCVFVIVTPSAARPA